MPSQPPISSNPKFRGKSHQSIWNLIDLPLMDYESAWKLQTDLVAARINHTINSDIVLFLEHPPVFTLGRRGGMENLCVPRKTLEKSGISIIQVERGGNITYHGPGQLIAYFIVNMAASNLGVKSFVSNLEDIMIRTASDWDVKAERNPLNAGIWVGNNKLGSIGIAVRRGISFHGFAMNVNLSMVPFGWINPCGLENVGVTSMRLELSRSLSMPDIRITAGKHLENVFHIKTRKLVYDEESPDLYSDLIARIQNRENQAMTGNR